RLYSGMNVSGYFVCASCYIHKCNYHKYHIAVRQLPRSWKTIAANAPPHKRTQFQFGDIDLPVWIDDRTKVDREDLKFIFQGSEMMHIIEGISPTLYLLITKSLTSNELPLLHASVKLALNRDDGDLSTKMTGRDWRKVWMLHETLFPERFWRSNRPLGRRIASLVRSFSLIIHENYSKAPRTRKRILRISALCFLFGQQARETFPSALYDLIHTHFHQL